MATDKELSDCLENVERRAFKQAAYAVRKDESALDIVQDAMIKLAEKYGDKPAAELPMLFQRILQNTILDYFRREKVRNTWVSLFSGMKPSGDEHEDFDILDKAHKVLRIAHSALKESHDQLQVKLTKEISTCPPFVLIHNTCATNPSCEHVHLVEENAKFK